jgi:hypothetical protein
MFSKMKIKNKMTYFSIICMLLISLISFSFAAETENINQQMVQLEDILNSSSTYSDFQTDVLLELAQNLIDAGISYEDTEEIVKNSVESSLKAYNIKKVFDVILEILETQEEGLPSEPLINKVNEGLAKNVDNNTIITAIFSKAENLQTADQILNEAAEEGLQINGGEELLKVLADSLENDVSEESLSWLLNAATSEGKSVQEIAEISEELSYLSLMASDSGFSSEEISLIFEKAMESDSNIDNICENIQSSLETEISAAQVGAGGGKPSASSGNAILPASSAGTPEVEIGGTPTHETGEAPSASPGAPESSPSPIDEEPSPPEN